MLVSGFDVSAINSKFTAFSTRQPIELHQFPHSISTNFVSTTNANNALSASSAPTVSTRNNRRSCLHMQASPSSPTYPIRIAVMGGGNFGLAMGTLCARQGYPTTILVRDEEIAQTINSEHRHPRYMQGIELPTGLRATSDPNECLPDATYIIHAVPCQYSRGFLESVKDFIPAQTPILSVSKGIETSSMGFMADLIKDVLGEDRPLAFLCPSRFPPIRQFYLQNRIYLFVFLFLIVLHQSFPFALAYSLVTPNLPMGYFYLLKSLLFQIK